ncbi:MAG: hydroxymethylbilane synthase, partial [Jatrophihabitantaceae bacterium]|nr:hydroxymethylbilane synthase [Jatrophihabitantaceae bacterium]
ALAIECRADDTAILALLARLDDPDSRAAVTAERALLSELEAGCSAPIGALADIAVGDGPDDSELFLRANVTALDGSDAVRLSATGPPEQAEAIGRRLAQDLLTAGADTMMGSRT